jgi:TetR/AcrR family tetracycline transcriptional repressor
VDGAIKILDEMGLENVTLRRLAVELGVQAPTLYFHLTDKQELIDWMAQAILNPALVELETDVRPTDWEEWLGTRVRSLRQAMLAHREGGRVVAGARFNRAVSLAAISDGTIKGLVVAGFPLTKARLATKTLLSYLFGFVIEEQALADAQSGQTPLAEEEPRFPLLAAALDEASTTGQNQQTDFEQGLQFFLAGIRIS